MEGIEKCFKKFRNILDFFLIYIEIKRQKMEILEFALAAGLVLLVPVYLFLKNKNTSNEQK